MKFLKKKLKKKKYVVIPLKKIATNHLQFSAKINGVKGHFILDTGASNSCVGLNAVAHFNLVTEDTDTKAAGAGAIDMDTQLSKNNTLKIKKWFSNNLTLVLFDLSHVNTALQQHKVPEVNGIIGADILEVSNAIIDYKNKLLYLKKIKNN